MEHVTKINGMTIKSFDLGEKEHNIAVRLIAHDNAEEIDHCRFSLSCPDKEVVQAWIDNGDDNAKFLSDALKSNASIYTLYEHIFDDAAQPLGEVAVFSED